MRILYAVQGTGNGHLSRARDIIPILQNRGSVDILISGTEADVALPFEIKYRFGGLSFVFGKNGGVDIGATYRKGNLKRFFAEVKSLPVHEYDVIINDFEPVSAWACRLNHKPCFGLSHQSAVVNKNAPRPKKYDPLGIALLHYYAPTTFAFGFHFKQYDSNIFTPVIRSQVREAKPITNNYFSVYLPAWSDKKIIKVLSQADFITWFIFSKHAKEPYKVQNIYVWPINNDLFIESLVACKGILCGAGFECPAEALFLKKKLMVIPMTGQYEQQCNAAALKQMGIPVLKSLKEKYLGKIVSWANSSEILDVHFDDNTAIVVDRLLAKAAEFALEPAAPVPAKHWRSFKKFRHHLSGMLSHKTLRN